MRPAVSNLEALLVEAELICRLRPPFNRQMRSWQRYCYLCAADRPYGQLALGHEPDPERPCFGPFRSRFRTETMLTALADYFGVALCPDGSAAHHHTLLPPGSPARLCRRYFAGRCAGPCGGRCGAAVYRDRIRARDAFLFAAAADTPAQVARELAALERMAPDESDATRAERHKQLSAPRDLGERAVLLAEARALLGALLIMPGPGTTRVVAVVCRSGLHLESLRCAVPDAERVVRWYRQRVNSTTTAPAGTLPKTVADALCTAALQLRRNSESCTLIAAHAMTELTTAQLRQRVFGSLATGCACG
ncbi:MAG: hypothetical protein KKB50_02160 [Planctomycetes bacterium]|nr:hypothetical protein [Planctomycetota bacterium]